MAKIFTFILLTYFVSQSASLLELGRNVCNEMWSNTESNLEVPDELNVDIKKDHAWFELTSKGKEKVDASKVFGTFEALVKDNANTNLQDAFLDEIMEGGPMEKALIYLTEEKILPEQQNFEDAKKMLKETLRNMWFKPNPGKGFAHVFVGEKSAESYTGFHNWYQFYLQQAKITNFQAIFYSWNKKPPKFLKPKFEWDNLPKSPKDSTNNMLVGTSPAFDFALFSVCFLAQEGGKKGTDCTCSIGETKLSISVFPQTSTAIIATAYPWLVQ